MEALRAGVVLVEHSAEKVYLIDILDRTSFRVPPHLTKELVGLSLTPQTSALSTAAKCFLGELGLLAHDTASNDEAIAAQLQYWDSVHSWYLGNWLDREAYHRVYRQVLRAHIRRKFIRYFCFQGPCLPETSTRRALMISADAPKGRILCIGDDDLTSIGLGVLGHQVTVVDIDERLLELIATTASEFGLSIQTINYDVREPLLPELLRGFDAVTLDPVSSENWFRLLLSRATSCLKLSGRCYLSVYDRKEHLARLVMRELGLKEIAFYQGFSHYYDEHIDYQSSLDASLHVAIKEQNTIEPILFPQDRFVGDLADLAKSFSNSFMLDFYGCKELSAERFQALCSKIELHLKISGGEIYISPKQQTLIYQARMETGYLAMLGQIESEYLGFDLHDLSNPGLNFDLVETVKEIVKPLTWKVFEKSRFVSHLT